MATADITRIRSNFQNLNVLLSLKAVNEQVALHQLRLATGRRINSAADDPAGMTISAKLEARNRNLQAIYDNIGRAKNLLSVAEGSLLNINDILVTMGEKIESAASDAMGTAERQAISQQLVGLTGEDVITSANYSSYLNEVNAALVAVAEGLTDIGSLANCFTIKENNISVGQTNTEAAFSRIKNADMAREHFELTKVQILQQTSTAMLAQANLNSQAILALFS